MHNSERDTLDGHTDHSAHKSRTMGKEMDEIQFLTGLSYINPIFLTVVCSGMPERLCSQRLLHEAYPNLVGEALPCWSFVLKFLLFLVIYYCYLPKIVILLL